MREDDDRSWYWIACGMVLLAAAVARILHLGDALFEDETWVAQLVRDGSWHPHSFATPVLFYILERGWTALRGASDVALREIPLIFGVALAALPLAADRLAPGLTDRTTRFAWSVLLAASSPLLYYSTRMKQYTLEAFVAALLMLLFFGAMQSPSRARLIAFFAAALVAVLTLISPIFTIAAAGITFLTTRHRRMPAFWIGFAATAIAFAVAYFGWARPSAESTRLHGDMDLWFTQTQRWMDRPSLIVPATQHWLGQAFNLVRWWWFVVSALVIYWLARGGAWRIVLYASVAPLVILIASVFHFYPYGEVRLMSFAFPAIYLVAAAALARLRWLALVLLVPFVLAIDVYDRTYMRTGAATEPHARALSRAMRSAGGIDVSSR